MRAGSRQNEHAKHAVPYTTLIRPVPVKAEYFFLSFERRRSGIISSVVRDIVGILFITSSKIQLKWIQQTLAFQLNQTRIH